MSKRILLAEASDAIRGVAEPLLRQNGFEVISVPTADRAWGVLELSKPDLIIAGADLTVAGGSPFYEKVQTDPKTQSVPILVIAQPGDLPEKLPEASRMALPLQPKAFLQKVSALAESTGRPAGSSSNPLQDTDGVDDMVDQALGLDQIEVTDSEVMDETTQVRLRQERQSKKPAPGEGVDDQTDDDLMRTGRVEIVNIEDDQTDIVVPNKQKQAAPPDPSSSGKLEILSDADQYAMDSPEELHADPEQQNHDYEWFMRELQKEASGEGAPESQAKPEPPSSEPARRDRPQEQSAQARQSHPGGVAEFIDEFKKEVEKIHQDEADRVILQEPKPAEPEPQQAALSTQGRRSWEDTLDRITPEQIDLFCSRFTRELADRIAERIAAKIDPDKLLRLIRDEVLAEAKRTPKK